MSSPPVPSWVKPAVLYVFVAIVLAYGWSSYSQRFVLTNEPDAAKDSGAVRVESSFSSRDLSPGEEATLNVVITNRSAQTLTKPWAVIETPGLFGDRTLPRLTDVTPGERMNNAFQLHAGQGQGQFRSRVTVGWTANGQPVVTLLTPPSVVIRGPMARASWIAVTVQAVSKDLALPIIVVILAAIFKRLEEDEKLKREDRQRDDDRRSETWQLLLTRHSDFSSLYYLPLLTAINQYQTSYKTWVKTKAPIDAQKAFYFLLLTFWRMRRLQKKIGGLHFKNRDGEQVLAEAWRHVVLQVEAAFNDRAKRDAAIDALGTDDEPMSFPVYAKRLEPHPPFSDLRASYVAWETMMPGTKDVEGKERLRLENISALLDLFHALAKFECNRPYEYWYEVKPLFPARGVETFIASALYQDKRFAKLQTHMDRYREALRNEKYESEP